MDTTVPSNLSELLSQRSTSSTAGISFLNDDGEIVQITSYAALYDTAQDYARRLLLSGILPNGVNVIIASFENHYDHILLFWACCLAGIPLCPIPPLHSEETRRILFLNHLQTLFNKPILIGSGETISIVQALVPSFNAVSWSHLQTLPSCESFGQQPTYPVYPEFQPDIGDIVCFMLTSGSTGNSKAVGLRHSNFLSCVRGKAKHHGSDKSSRFLNWIAFDHVACVSEVHLQALVVDAWQFHVSPAAVIRTPRNLLEWTSKYQITYTFSPNFLVAQIVRDFSLASPVGPLDLSPVVAFISGGEAVPTKTAVEFTDILARFGARRNVLRAGFGMTETCAGCIYDTRDIPTDTSQSSPKYLSLGTCCSGVTMRVIDHATGLPCPPFKEGQLQVAGPSVFREYHNNPKATAESFSGAWFITGDTAIIDNEGNLHLMGRDKDCININGVKHPTVDVEHFIEDSHIDGVPRSYIYVCPMRLANADTETYGVFYQHELPVEGELSPADLTRILATNRALKRACVLFCSQSPHIILPLPRPAFVKTALGKVSRSFLAAAYLKGTYGEVEDKLKEAQKIGHSDGQRQGGRTETIILEIVSDLFGAPLATLSRDMSLFDLGVSSMHIAQLKYTLQERFGIPDIPTIDMLRRPEINELASFLDDILTGERATSPYDPLILLHPHGSKPPLFLVHPGVGEILIFIRLAQILEDDRPIYALRARGFDDTDEPFATFDEMVNCYVARIVQAYRSGPYYVAGYSFGGAVAFEITKKLEGLGKRVAWTGILNLPPEIKFRMVELVWLEVVINLLTFLVLIPTTAFEEVKQSVIAAFPELHGTDSEPEASMEIIHYLFSLSDQDRLAELQLNMEDFKRWVSVAYKVTCCGRTYTATGSVKPALMTIFCAVPLPSLGTREEYKRQRLSCWRTFAQSSFELVDVDGEHYTMISEDHVASFAQKLRVALTRATKLFNSKPRRAQRVPVIDFGLSRKDRNTYLQQLHNRLKSDGFCILENVPGLEDAFQKEVFALAERFFYKPQEWKDALSVSKSRGFRGYIHVGEKTCTEGCLFGAEPEVPRRNDTEFPQEVDNIWPSEFDVPNFKQKMNVLFEKYHALSVIISDHICDILELPSTAISSYIPDDGATFRLGLWHHSPDTQSRAREAPGEPQEYCDLDSFVTLITQFRPGLEVKNREGKWIGVPYVPGGVICTIGMQLMRLTGGRFAATAYRVNTTALERDSYTIPYALFPREDQTVVVHPQFEGLGLSTLLGPARLTKVI